MKKRSLLKRMVALTAALLVGTMGITVGAASDEYMGAGNDKGSITVHKYSRLVPSGEENPYGEEITDTSNLGTPLNGVGYTVYKITMPENPNKLHLTGECATVFASDKQSVLITFATEEGTPLDGSGTIIETEKLTANGGVVVFGKNGDESTLEQGQYLLVESTPPDNYTPAAPAIITIPRTGSSGGDFNCDIHVYPKNVSTNNITKKIENPDKTYVVGDTVSFRIDAEFSNKEEGDDRVDSIDNLYVAPNYGKMWIEDELVSGLEYVTSEAYYMAAAAGEIELEENIHYEIKEKGNKITWTLKEDGIKHIIDSELSNGKGISFGVKITARIRISEDKLENTAKSYVVAAEGSGGDPDPGVTDPEKVPAVTVGIKKVDVDDLNTPLAGATFAIAVDAAASTFLLEDGNVVSGLTTVDLLNEEIATRASKPGSVNIALATTKATFDGKGHNAFFTGLAYDKDRGETYRLVEVKAPDNYNLKKTASEANIEKDIEDLEIYKQALVKNTKIGKIDPEDPVFTLPLTGGTGTILFTLIGILMMSATVVLVVRSKKRTN